jgi:hypothetical protein
MADNSAALSGNITRFQIYQAKNGGDSIDMSTGTVELNYYESVLSNSVSASVTIVETGFTDKKVGDTTKPRGIIDTLPIRGGEQVILEFEDAQATPNKLSFKAEKSLYVNRVRGIDPGTQKDVYSIDLCTREFIANEQTRVVKRYDGKVSDSIAKLLTDKNGLNIEKNIEIDVTAVDYNFIGNDRKPFYVCTWLASKSIPELSVDGKNSIGGAAGYFFFENYNGFQFRSLDKLLDEKGRTGIKKYIYNGNPDKPEEYDGKILSVNIERDIDLQQNLTLGTYANRSLFFDFAGMKYVVRDYNVDENQKDRIKNAGSQEITWVAEDFRKGPSRLMNHILDVGVLPPGATPGEQLNHWKQNKEKPTYDAANTMVQSIMRYNQLFTIKTNIIIPGDFSLRAGDLIHCDFPELTVDQNKDTNKQSGGIYMISSLCHRISPGKTYTSLALVRDTFGRKPFK